MTAVMALSKAGHYGAGEGGPPSIRTDGRLSLRTAKARPRGAVDGESARFAPYGPENAP